MNKIKEQIKKILISGIAIFIGLLIFKNLPMLIWGPDILFDASRHVALTIWGFYVLWFFIDQNKKWRIPYFIFAAAVTIIMAIQRIIAKQHNEIGVLLGMAVGLSGIALAERKSLKGKFIF